MSRSRSRSRTIRSRSRSRSRTCRSRLQHWKTQAEHIWSMLDDMAASDPSAYRKFIDRQMKEGKEALAPPDPHMCVQTMIYKPKTILFINFCGWTRIPEPKSDQDAIPVVGGQLETVQQNNNESYKLVSVSFNPKVLAEFGRNAKRDERRALVELAVDYLRDQHQLEISKNYHILSEDTPLKGSVENMRQSFKSLQSNDDKKFEDDLDELEKTFGPSGSGMKDSLLKELSSISGGEHKPSGDLQPDILSGLSDNNKTTKSKLIEEIGIKDTPISPEYNMDIKDDRIMLSVQLPGVQSVAVCQLDISEDDVCLYVPEKYNLNLQLPHQIQDEESTAKFSKKLEELTITMPFKS